MGALIGQNPLQGRRFTFRRGPLHGEIPIPGDKSISHRALILGAALPEPLQVHNLNPGCDVAATLTALRALGADTEFENTTAMLRPAPLRSTNATIDCQNSGSTVRMLLGACAGANVHACFDGDDSLRRRPMEPVAAQLRAFGAKIETREGYLPVSVAGTVEIQTRRFILLAPSAQIKTALLFAGVYAKTPITISNDAGSRDHTERLLQALGAEIRFNGRDVEYTPRALLSVPLRMPGDFSGAAFFIAGASISPGSSITIKDVGVNPTRTGLLDALDQMGARIALSNHRDWNNEPVADILVEAAELRGAAIGPEVALRAIDDIPALAVAAACASGVTRISGLRRLREKESDRVSAIERVLDTIGVPVDATTDGIEICGISNPTAKPRSLIEIRGDHRIAMCAAALAARAGPIGIDNLGIAGVSFPDFARVWARAQR